MIYHDCPTCRKRGRCDAMARHCRESLFAFGRGLPAPDCKDYLPRLSRGVPGVIDFAPSPRPSRRVGETSTHYGDRAC